MKILVINAGQSSLKYQLIDVESGDVIAKGFAEPNRHRKLQADL